MPHESGFFGKFSDHSVKNTQSPQTLLLLSVLCILSLVPFVGCTRQHYRQKADREVYSLLHSGGTKDPRWKLKDHSIKVDRRSRMYNPHNPDCEPMPPDDLAAHRKMLRVDGKKGSKHWNDNGFTQNVESPCWRQYLLFNENGEVSLDKDVSVDLALIHSPEYQAALENLYLSAMRVSQERFRFDVQFFGGDSLFYTANGRLRDGSSTTLANDSALQASKMLASGGELVVGLANSITWTFNGQNTWQGDSLLNVGLVQPLLRGAGRKIVLEDLTQSERDFLAAIRQMVFFQQGFYTKTITGQGRQAAPSGSIGSGNTPNFGSGFYGLLARQIQIQNLRQNIIGLEENLQRFQAIHDANQIDIFSVEETRQSLLTSESQLLAEISNFDSDVDTYLRSLGLPPDLKVEIKDPLMEQFQLTSLSLLDLQEDINALLADIRETDEPIPDDFHERVQGFMERTRSEIVILDNDLQVLDRSIPERLKGLKSLQAQLAEQIERGERIDPSVYSETIFLERIADLKEKEIPENLEKLDAVFMLVDLIVQTDVETLTEMIKTDNFSEEIQQALTLLKLNYVATIEKDAILRQRQSALDKSNQELANLREIAQLEAAAAAEALQNAEMKGLESKYLADVAKDEDIQEFLAKKESKQNQPLTDAQLVIKDLNATDPYRVWVQNILAEYQYEVSTLSIMQTKTRLHAVTLVPTEIAAEDAFRIAEQNRLDWMNERATLVDNWRQIELAANRLRGDLSLHLDGEIGSIDKDGIRFDRDNSQLRIGMAWDSPLTRHGEMLAYRQSQIQYQAARRQYYTYVDSVNASIRQIIRDIRMNQVNFEIRRNAVLVAATQLDSAQLKLKEPVARGTTIDTDTSRQLVSSLLNILNTQNQFLNTWVDYQTARMQLDLNMGTMELDGSGRWIDPGIMTKDRQGPASKYPNTPSLTPRRAKHHGKHAHGIIENNGGHAIPPAPRLENEPTLAPQAETTTETESILETMVGESAEEPSETAPAIEMELEDAVDAAEAVKPEPTETRSEDKSAFDLDTVPAPVASSAKKAAKLKNAPPPPKTPE